MNARPEHGGAPPTPDELLAMAFADGELSPEERLAFEKRLTHESALGQLVAENMALDVLARRIAPKEPQDHEWARLQLDPFYRTSVFLGWMLVILGSLATLALTIFGVATNESLTPLIRILILSSLLGFLLLFLSILMRRLRTLPLDPYRHVER